MIRCRPPARPAALALYGGWLLVTREDRLGDVALWLVTGRRPDDAVLAIGSPGALAVRLAPAPARAPLAVGFVVLGPVTPLAVPVLVAGSVPGGQPDAAGPRLMAGWLVLARITTVAVVRG